MSRFSQRSLGLFSYRQICGGRARQIIQIFSFACLMLATTSCGWVKLKADAYKDSKEYSETEFRKAESIYYKSSSTTPEFCVALSGGGIRSAAYSIGVLKGLHESGKLRVDGDVKIISAVSGGSYAATWLYAQYAKYKSRPSSPDDALQMALSRTSIEEVARNVGFLNAKLMGKGFVIEGKSTDMALPATQWDVISGLAIYTGGVIWSWVRPWDEGHETKAGRFYETVLGETFHFSPGSVEGHPIQTASEALPYLIVNATIPGVGDSNRPLANGIFEFTPYGMGSPSVGYTSWDKLKPEHRAHTYSYSRIASISGAVVDKRQITLMNAIGRDLGLGYAMLEPTYTNGLNEFLVLTDGGHLENLGAYGLIKRKCNKILVVDAEYDGRPEFLDHPFNWIVKIFSGKSSERHQDSYQFEGYGKLKTNLEKEKLTLQVDTLDQATKHWGKKENHEPMSDGQTPSGKKWNCWPGSVKANPNWFDCSNPIRTGFVYRCQDQKCNQIAQEDMHITYAKLSTNRELLDDSSEESKAKARTVYGPLITGFYEKEGKRDKDFPHYSTMLKPIWSEKEFLVIAELGCRAVRQHYDKKFRQSEEVCIGDN